MTYDAAFHFVQEDLTPELAGLAYLATGDDLGSMAVILKKDGRPARQFVPFAQYCSLPETKALMPGESVYEALFVSAGQNGWDVAEPGRYTVQVALHSGREEYLVSNPLRLAVEPPLGERKGDEERLAQDFFSEEVGRILWFGGSRFLEKGNDTLREAAERLSDRRVAVHANAALGNAVAREYKQLNLGDAGRGESQASGDGRWRDHGSPPERGGGT